jgi:hypothetical protein
LRWRIPGNAWPCRWFRTGKLRIGGMASRTAHPAPKEGHLEISCTRNPKT